MEDRFEIRRRRLRRMIDESGSKLVASFADRFGYTRAQISQYLSASYNGGRSIGERAARSLEEKTGYPTGWLDIPDDDSIEQVEHYAPPARSQEDREIPILLVATPESDGLLSLNSPDPKDQGRCVRFVTIDPQAYAYQVKGGGLRPRVRSHEYLVFEPGVQATPGDDVLVRLVDGSFVLTEFLYDRDGELTLGHFTQEAPPSVVDLSEVVSIHRLAAILSRGQPTQMLSWEEVEEK